MNDNTSADEALDFIRYLGEECANAGMARGDRTVVLANVRGLIGAVSEALASNMIGSNEPSVTISRASYDKMLALMPRSQ
jgi:hypothetical protein